MNGIPIKEAIKVVLVALFTGCKLHEESFAPGGGSTLQFGKYANDEIDCFTEACGGDSNLGLVLHLFNHWNNDLQDYAGYFGIGFSPSGELVEVDPAIWIKEQEDSNRIYDKDELARPAPWLVPN